MQDNRLLLFMSSTKHLSTVAVKV